MFISGNDLVYLTGPVFRVQVRNVTPPGDKRHTPHNPSSGFFLDHPDRIPYNLESSGV
jgi:hypothetical protein